MSSLTPEQLAGLVFDAAQLATIHRLGEARGRHCPGVSRDMVRVVLRELRDEGAITPQGKGRGARWIANRGPLLRPGSLRPGSLDAPPRGR